MGVSSPATLKGFKREYLMSLHPIRILHLIASNFVGGPEKQILHHAVDVCGSDFEIWIGSFRDQPEKAEILRTAEEKGLPVYESLSSGKFDPRAIFELASFLKREKIRLLCSHGFKANIVGALAKTHVGIPQIAFCRGWTAETARVRLYEMLERRFLGLADKIICVSEAQADYFGARHFLQPRISVVHNAMLDSVDTVRLHDRVASKTKLGFPADLKLVGAVGRLSTEKGQRYLVEAAPKLHNEFANLRIVLLGEGRERASLESRVKQLGLQDVVVLPGFQRNIGLWMQAFDALANCSLSEGIPNAILEAMAAGTPVVATAVGGVPELIKDRKTGLLVPPGDPNSLAVGLTEVLRDTELSSRFSEAGRDWVRSHFSAAGQRDSLLRIYRETLGLPVEQPAKDLPPDTGVPSSNRANSKGASTDSNTDKLPFLSIVIPVRNEEIHIGSVLGQLATQNWPHDRLEILVANGDSTDSTAEVVDSFAKHADISIRLIDNPLRLSSAGRNLGARAARGDYILFVDGHCSIPSRNMLRDAVNLFEKTGAHCLCRPQPLTMHSNTVFQNVVAHARATSLGHGRDSTIYDVEYEGPVNPASAGALYRGDVFDRIGYFDEHFDACEDVEFNTRVWKAGLTSVTSPLLTVIYQPRDSVFGLLKQMVRYGQGRCRLVRKHRDLFTVPQVVPAIFLVGLVLGGVGAFFSPIVALTYLASLFLYGISVLGFSVLLGRRFGIAHLFLAPLVYLSIHLGLGAGFLKECFRSLWTSSPSGTSGSVDEQRRSVVVSRSNQG